MNSTKTIAVRGAAVTLVGQLLRIGIQLISVIGLARMLSPSDFGLMAMVLIFVGVGEIIRDAGLSSATVQSQELSSQQSTNLFWANIFIGFILSIIMFFGAPVIATLFNNDSLEPVTRVVSVIFVISALGAQSRALLNRRMRFRSLALVEVLSSALALLCALVMAFSDFGVWALVAQQLATSFLMSLGLIFAAKWLPGRPGNWKTSFPHFRFGFQLLVSQIVNYIGKSVDSVVIGISLGSTAVGYYDRAFQLLMMPLNQLNAPATRVALPVLSKFQNDRTRFNSHLLSAQTVLLHPIVFLFTLAAISSKDLVSIVLGDEWAVTGSVFQILCFGGFFLAANYSTYWAFLASGNTKSLMKYSFVSRPVFIAIIVVGSFWGIYAIATAYVVGLGFLWLFGAWWARKSIEAPAGQMVMKGISVIAAYGLCGVPVYLIHGYLLNSWGPVPRTLMDLLLLLMSVGLLTLLWPGFRRDVLMILSSGRLLKARVQK